MKIFFTLFVLLFLQFNSNAQIRNHGFGLVTGGALEFASDIGYRGWEVLRTQDHHLEYTIGGYYTYHGKASVGFDVGVMLNHDAFNSSMGGPECEAEYPVLCQQFNFRYASNRMIVPLALSVRLGKPDETFLKAYFRLGFYNRISLNRIYKNFEPYNPGVEKQQPTYRGPQIFPMLGFEFRIHPVSIVEITPSVYFYSDLNATAMHFGLKAGVFLQKEKKSS